MKHIYELTNKVLSRVAARQAEGIHSNIALKQMESKLDAFMQKEYPARATNFIEPVAVSQDIGGFGEEVVRTDPVESSKKVKVKQKDKDMVDALVSFNSQVKKFSKNIKGSTDTQLQDLVFELNNSMKTMDKIKSKVLDKSNYNHILNLMSSTLNVDTVSEVNASKLSTAIKMLDEKNKTMLFKITENGIS